MRHLYSGSYGGKGGQEGGKGGELDADWKWSSIGVL